MCWPSVVTEAIARSLNSLPTWRRSSQRTVEPCYGFSRSPAEQGPPRNVEVSHKIAGDIWELIAGQLRVLWFYDEGRVIVCSHGFVKRTRKIPSGEIDRAQAACQEYRAAKKTRTLTMVED